MVGVAADQRWADCAAKIEKGLFDQLQQCRYPVKGRGPFGEEFVTAGGVDLGEINLATKCLDFCQALSSQGVAFNFSLSIGSTFSFSLDTRGKASLSPGTKKKSSPSTLRRNARRRKKFLEKKQNPAPVIPAEEACWKFFQDLEEEEEKDGVEVKKNVLSSSIVKVKSSGSKAPGQCDYFQT